MDTARYLHTMMFDNDGLGALKDELRKSVNYLRGHRQQYENLFELDSEKVHQKVRAQWTGRGGHAMTAPLQQWVTLVVTPCMSVEPGMCVQDHLLQRLLDYMGSQPDSDPQDLQLVRAIVTGRVARHPAVHGTMLCCFNKLEAIEKGNTTFRNRHRLSTFQKDGVGWSGMVLVSQIWYDVV